MLTTVLSVMLSMATTPTGGGQWTIPMYLVDQNGTGKPIGVVQVTEAKEGGLTFTPQLTGLPPGPHGFHVHENPSCAPLEKDGKKVAALGAGGHYDPKGSKKHEGPAGQGHLGDLPLLVVAPDGTAGKPLAAPRLKLADLRGRSLMIHAGGDNFSDSPQALGGGGARIACGIVP